MAHFDSWTVGHEAGHNCIRFGGTAQLNSCSSGLSRVWVDFCGTFLVSSGCNQQMLTKHHTRPG